jgi:hypothetical protein
LILADQCGSPIHLTGAVALLLTLNCVVQAADTSPSYPVILVDDVKHVLTAPTLWPGKARWNIIELYSPLK